MRSYTFQQLNESSINYYIYGHGCGAHPSVVFAGMVMPKVEQLIQHRLLSPDITR